METLGQLFGSTARVKLLRLFIFNLHSSFTVENIASKTRLAKSTIRRELRTFEKIDLVRRKETGGTQAKKQKTTKSKKGAKQTLRTKKKTYFSVNQKFIYVPALAELLSLNDPVNKRDVVERFKKVGRIKLITISGIFIGNEQSRVDLLIVGDNLRKREVERAVRALEAEVGREISYTALDTSEFMYRATAKDRLLRDIFDYPHERLLEKIEFEIF